MAYRKRVGRSVGSCCFFIAIDHAVVGRSVAWDRIIIASFSAVGVFSSRLQKVGFWHCVQQLREREREERLRLTAKPTFLGTAEEPTNKSGAGHNYMAIIAPLTHSLTQCVCLRVCGAYISIPNLRLRSML